MKLIRFVLLPVILFFALACPARAAAPAAKTTLAQSGTGFGANETDPGREASRHDLVAAQKAAVRKAVARHPPGNGAVTISGELRQWHNVTLNLAGPFADESDTAPIPFTDLALTVTFTHESGRPTYKVPGYFAIAGFLLTAAGLVMSVQQHAFGPAIFWLSVAVFGVDMILSPSWSFCIDIGGKHAGQVSGTMNMAGNLGSAIIGPAFPALLAWTGSADVFFHVIAACSLLAAACWIFADPTQKISELP